MSVNIEWPWDVIDVYEKGIQQDCAIACDIDTLRFVCEGVSFSFTICHQMAHKQNLSTKINPGVTRSPVWSAALSCFHSCLVLLPLGESFKAAADNCILKQERGRTFLKSFSLLI